MFYGCEHSDLKPTNGEFAFVGSLGGLYRLLLGCWRRETCAPRLQDKWSESNPTCGQCSIHRIEYMLDIPQKREIHFAKAEKKSRYEALKAMLMRRVRIRPGLDSSLGLL